MRETCTSGSVRGEGGNVLAYSAPPRLARHRSRRGARRRAESQLESNARHHDHGRAPVPRSQLRLLARFRPRTVRSALYARLHPYGSIPEE